MSAELRGSLAKVLISAVMDTDSIAADEVDYEQAHDLADAILASGVLDQVRAEAWDEGYRTCGMSALSGARVHVPNPYRATEAKPGSLFDRVQGIPLDLNVTNAMQSHSLSEGRDQ